MWVSAEIAASLMSVKRRSLCNRRGIFGEICPSPSGDTERSRAYVLFMLSTLLVIGGVLVGLLVLLALIVSLSARPQARTHHDTARGNTAVAHGPSWTADAGRPHPDAWSPLSTTSTSEIPAVH
jgi:hypothetical protein